MKVDLTTLRITVSDVVVTQDKVLTKIEQLLADLASNTETQQELELLVAQLKVSNDKLKVVVPE